jgi:hypothetical protein
MKYTVVKTHEKIERTTFVRSKDIEKCVKFERPMIFFKNISKKIQEEIIEIAKNKNYDNSNIDCLWSDIIKKYQGKITAIKITHTLYEDFIYDKYVFDISRKIFIPACYFYKDNKRFIGFDEIQNKKVKTIEISKKLFEIDTKTMKYQTIKINTMEHLKIFEHPIFEEQKVALHFHANDNIWKTYILNMESNTRHLYFCGLDSFSRPIYKTLETTSIWKDTTLGSLKPELYNCSSFEGEPDCPVKKDLNVVYINQYFDK